QPYTVLDIDNFLFDSGYDYWRQKNILLGACCFDRERGFLYVLERRADDEKSIVHVWKVVAGATGIENHDHPMDFELYQNYPNPFNATTVIGFRLGKPSMVTLTVFDCLGRKIKTVLNQQMLAGEQKVYFDAKDLASGIYFYKIKVDKFERLNKLVVLK
ncbi:MAG: T9SS type A sorting domain-containing protein, partial [bacterium]|nr:T9SS type A sorting domain-containing protein [bacterium]